MAKKTILILLAILLAAVLLCACEANNTVQPAPAQPEADSAQTAAAAQTEQPQTAEETTQPDEQETENQAQPDEPPAPEKGADGVWSIASAEGLALLAEEPDGAFRLTADIDLGGAAWKPVGSASAPFTGELDGCGYTVSNFTIEEADGLCGFFGVLEGSVKRLELAGLTLEAQDGNVGAIAADSRGTIDGCSAEGTLRAGAQAVAGGLVGTADGGAISGCTAQLRIEADAAAVVGLFGGRLTNVALTSCVYAGERNTRGGELFTAFAGAEQNVRYESCLYRDNRNSDELLSPQVQALRQTCLESSYAQGTLEWTPDRTLMFVCSCGSPLHTQEFKAGETYHGIPYTHKQGSLERFAYCFNDDGTLKDWVPDMGYDGFDLYIGNDCSGAIYWAWAKVSDDISFKWTYTMLPEYGSGTVKVGEYNADDTTTPPMFERNSKRTMLEAYAQLHAADAIVTYHSGENHARLCTRSAVVFRDQSGEIDPTASYLVTNAQGDGISEHVDHSTWVIDRKYTFEEIYNGYYIPISIQELQDGVVADAEVTIDNDKQGAAYLCAGTIRSNYRINSVTAALAGTDGSEIWSHTIFTGIGKWESVESDTLLRETVKSFEMADFASALTTAPLEQGTQYTYTVRVLLGTGEEYTVKSFSFTA